MNTLELNFGYLPWTDVDELLGTPVRSTPEFLRFLFATPWPWQTVLKCHYHPAFLPVLPRLVERFDVVHVVREPAAALRSFWRYIRGNGPEHGPQTETPGEFVRARPSGAMRRYQSAEVDTVAARWCAHTAGWLEARQATRGAITLVRYEDLDQRFADTVAQLGDRLRKQAGPLTRPTRQRKVVFDPRWERLTADFDADDRASLDTVTARTRSAVARAADPGAA